MIDVDSIKDSIKSTIDLVGSDIQIDWGTTQTYQDGVLTKIENLSDTFKAIIENYNSNEIQGLVQSGDIKITILNDNINITTSDRILFDGAKHNIVNIVPIMIDNQKLTYEVQVRK